MDRCVKVISYDPLVNENGVLIVVTFPCCKSDENVLTESKLTVIGSGTVGDDVACLDLVTHGNDGALVDTCALVGSLILGELISVDDTVLSCDPDLVSCYEAYDTAVLSNLADT